MRSDFDCAYDKKRLLKCLIFLVFMAVAMKVTSGNGILVIVPFVIIALSRNDMPSLFFYVMVLISMTMGNSTLMPKSALFAISERAILTAVAFIMMSRVFGRKGSTYCAPLLTLLWYIAFMCVSSTCGWCPIVSYLKLFLFTSIFVAYYATANGVIVNHRTDVRVIRSVVLSVAIFFLVGSVLLIPTGLGIMTRLDGMDITRFEGLYMGMTMHSQSLGPITAALGVMVFSDFVYSIRRADKLYLLLMACVPILVWKTSSRTAMGTLMVGIAVVTYFFMKTRSVQSTWKSKVLTSMLLLVAVGAGVAISSSSSQIGIKKFILKYADETASDKDFTLTEITSSRQGLVESAVENFRKSPMIGNGFQVSEGMAANRISEFKLILTAPIEKGVWTTAILEEGGVIGMAIFILFLVTTVVAFIKRRCYTALATLIVLVVSNFGEFTMFSMSYTGGMMWALVFAGSIMDALRECERRVESMSPPYPTPGWR